MVKVSKGAKIRNRYNQVPHLTQDTNGKVTNSETYTTKESLEVNPFPAGDHKAHVNICAQRHNKHKLEKNIKDAQKKYHLQMVSKNKPKYSVGLPLHPFIIIYPSMVLVICIVFNPFKHNFLFVGY